MPEFERRVKGSARRVIPLISFRPFRYCATWEQTLAGIVIRYLSPETLRALKAQASQHGSRTEAEARMILDEATRSVERIRLGSALAAFVQPFGGIELDILRDKAPPGPIELE